MSLLTPFIKRNKLNETIKKTQQARASEGATADSLFKASYQGYAEVLQDDPLRADTLYHWGFALLHQAQTKTGPEAVALYQDAIAKFAFCLLINPNYLGAAVNDGVAHMDLARLNNAKADDTLYTAAQQQFETANRIQKASASYNLACIYALQNDMDACRTALDSARDHGVLPGIDAMQSDSDLANASQHAWFQEFLQSLAPDTAEHAQPAQTIVSDAATEPNSGTEASERPLSKV